MTTRADGPFASVLDAGAGMGVSTRVFADRAQRTVALDISRKMLRELWPAPRVEGNFDHLPFADGTFDGVAFTASLFLVPEPAVAVREAARVLRPGGVVGAVAPLGWVTDDGDDIFAALDREAVVARGGRRSRGGARQRVRCLCGHLAVRGDGRGRPALPRHPGNGGALYPKLARRNASRRRAICSTTLREPSNSGSDGSSASPDDVLLGVRAEETSRVMSAF